MKILEALEAAAAYEVAMLEGFLGQVDTVVLGGGQPLGHDVGVGQRAATICTHTINQSSFAQRCFFWAH